ncbi:MAG: cbb3-type cytochrome c oxidase subunit 3 [Alphaproteobacteria bacterium]|nr:cbb3-type cytochrome c oxidase subunit 3 [Alphaproteobacteria bacterium]
MELKTLYEVLRSSWTIIGIVTFLAVVAWAFWPANKAEFEKRARIPFDER